MNIKIRNETKNDERIVEEITKRAFWNIHEIGCNEHFLVHEMRKHKDFVKNLDLVIEVDGKIIGNIMYTKFFIMDDKKNKIETVTFGPVSIDKNYQRQGYGSKLIIESIQKVKDMGVSAIIIYGNPGNYVKFGFVGSKKYLITNGNGRYPCGLLVLVIKRNEIGKVKMKYFESDVYSVDNSKLDEFDKTFEKMEKYKNESQEEFYILSNAYLDD
jgi:putative acetyltransferase